MTDLDDPIVPVSPETLAALRLAYGRRRVPGGLRTIAERTEGLISHQTVVQVLKGNRPRVRRSTLDALHAALGVPAAPAAEQATPPPELTRRWLALLQEAFDAGRAYQAARDSRQGATPQRRPLSVGQDRMP